ncbi:ATP synthase delta chain [hydrothermal vent metagenome]|uniref:ATP synthase delta chain n=1 Tax=hydrothermal vent metagenome TaxID=652676 RepID=A0A3B0ZBV2_9ZZZZ
MADNSTLARPYARAIFDLAQGEKNLEKWSNVVGLLATIVSDVSMAAAISHPAIAKEKLAAAVITIGSDVFDEKAQNLIKLLVENGRLNLVPAMAELYEGYRAEAESTVQAEVIVATKLDEAQQQQLATALKKRLGRDVEISCSIDKSLLGGAIIRAGDLVIDGSVSGQLNKLANALTG